MNSKDVWILAEMDGGGLREFVFELVSEGRRVADKLGERLCGVLFAGDPEEIGESLSQFGVDTLYYVKAGDGMEVYIQILSQLIQKYSPRLLFVGATPMGSELSPQIAARNGMGIITDCVILKINDRGFFEATKMIYGDKVYATFEVSISPRQVFTVVPGSFDMANLGSKKRPELVIESGEITSLPNRIKYLEFLKGDPKKIDVTETEIIVAGGKGVGEAEGFKKIERLAEVLGGTPAGSRLAVDQGWVPFEKQIGQTGRTVSPKLFISCGISGAFEFTAGMKDSRLIVAINNDSKAPIFRVSNLSLVGDLHAVVPEIVKQLEKHLEEEAE
jgi:electron transfer flavoprotein alpha subunit